MQKKQQQNSLLNLSFSNKLQGITLTGSTFESFPLVLMDSASGIQDKKHSFGPPLGGSLGALQDAVMLLDEDLIRKDGAEMY